MERRIAATGDFMHLTIRDVVGPASRALATGAITAVTLALMACGGDGGSGPVAATMSVAPATPTLRVGESVTLVATPVDANGSVVSVSGATTWATGAATIATVDNAGKVTGVGAGATDITASIGRVSGSTRVTVLQLPVARVNVEPTSVSFNRTQTRQLTATTFAADNSALTGRTIAWTTSSTAVVTLSATSGATVTLTAVAPGTATVSAASEGITRDVTVTVAPDPVITFTPPAASLGATAGGANPTPLTVTVSNTGGGALGGLAAGTITYTAGQPTGWLTAAFDGATAAPAPLTLRATTGTLPVGAYTASVPVTSTAPGAASKNLAVTFNIGSAIMLGATPTSATFTAPPAAGNPASQPVSIFSVNGSVIPGLTLGAVEYAATQPTGWLTASLSGATTPATLTLQATVGTLPSGTYTANVPVSAGTATNSPLKVPVTLVVPAPLIALSATSRAFTATQGIGTAAGQTIQITNAGRGNLGGLQVAVSYTGGPTNWLSASLNTTTAPATLTLTPLANAIARGTYSATVQVSAAGVSNSPQAASVSYALVYTFDQHIAGTLANTVAPSGCSNSSCHKIGGQNPVLADSPANVYARLLAGYVTANNPDASVLYQRLNGSPSPMPPSGVNAAIRDAVKNWILDGARRN
jgi:hypothetical protein